MTKPSQFDIAEHYTMLVRSLTCITLLCTQRIDEALVHVKRDLDVWVIYFDNIRRSLGVEELRQLTDYDRQKISNNIARTTYLRFDELKPALLKHIEDWHSLAK